MCSLLPPCGSLGLNLTHQAQDKSLYLLSHLSSPRHLHLQSIRANLIVPACLSGFDEYSGVFLRSFPQCWCPHRKVVTENKHSGTTGQDLSFTGSVERFVAKGSRIFTNLLNPSSQVLIKIKRAKTTKFSSLPIVQPNVRKSHLKYTSPETRVVKNRLMRSKCPSYIPTEHCL